MPTKTYPLADKKKVTACLPDTLLIRWKHALQETGLTGAQAFHIAIALYYADFRNWTDAEHEGEMPGVVNFQVRTRGIVGTWLEEIVAIWTVKRSARNDDRPFSQSEAIRNIVSHFVALSESGKLMAPGIL